MKIYKISQNAQYLQNIGVPAESVDSILQYLLSLEKDTRKKVIRRVRQNPNISLEELQQPVGKEQHLKEQNVPQQIIDFSKSLSEKYSIWISREIVKWIKSITNWGEQRDWLKKQKEGKSVEEYNEIQDELNRMYMQKDPSTQIDYNILHRNHHERGEDLRPYMATTREWREVLDWIDQTDPDIMQMSFTKAKQASDAWHKELAEKERDESLQYKTHDVVHAFGDGWEIVKLSPGDCTPEGEMMGHCFAPNTLVRTINGYKPIESINIGEKVLCENGSFKPVIKVFERDYKGQMIKFWTRLGVDPIVVTPDHQFKSLVPNDAHNTTQPCRLHICGQKRHDPEQKHEISWKSIQEIGSIGYLLSTTPKETFDINSIGIPKEFILRKSKGSELFKVDEEFLWMVGMYLAEGSSDGDKIQFALSSNERPYYDRIKKFFENNGYHCWERKEKKNYNGLVIKISSRKLSKWFDSWLGHGCDNKSIPCELLNLPNNKIRFLLNGILDGDNFKASNSFHQTSKNLALQVTEIGLRLSKHTPTISKKDNSKINRKTSYTVVHADPRIERLAKSNKRLTWKHKGNTLVAPYSFEKIPYNGKVYNIEVDTIKSYVVQNILVHNCVQGYSDQIERGSTQIYSLRDPKNEPHVTIEMSIPKTPNEKIQNHYDMQDGENKKIEISQIQGKGNRDPIPEYKAYIKLWFDALKQQGYQFEPIDIKEYEDVDLTNFTEFTNKEDDYGIPMKITSIGGDADGWFEDLQDAYEEGLKGRRDFWEAPVIEIIDNLINYAIKQGEHKEFDKAVDKFNEWAFEEFNKWQDMNWDNMPLFPQEEDFTTYPDEDENQPEFKVEGFEEAKQEVFNEDAYNEAVKEYYNNIGYYEQEFTPTKISSYLIKEWNRAMEKAELRQPVEQPVAAKSNRQIKTAVKKIPDAEELAAYVEALNIHLENGKIKDPKIEKLVKRLPYPDLIRIRFSEEECRIVFESIGYAWEKITGQDIVEESKIERAPKGLEGNYWMISNGILLEGPNHFTIIKQNMGLFATLLNISTFVLHEKIASPPDELIKTIIDHGGMRIFVNKDKKMYCQVNPQTYSKWARAKIKKLDFKKKIVKVVDPSRPYKGWTTGITVLL
jgi:hypothetical protein